MEIVVGFGIVGFGFGSGIVVVVVVGIEQQLLMI